MNGLASEQVNQNSWMDSERGLADAGGDQIRRQRSLCLVAIQLGFGL